MSTAVRGIQGPHPGPTVKAPSFVQPRTKEEVKEFQDFCEQLAILAYNKCRQEMIAMLRDIEFDPTK